MNLLTLFLKLRIDFFVERQCLLKSYKGEPIEGKALKL